MMDLKNGAPAQERPSIGIVSSTPMPDLNNREAFGGFAGDFLNEVYRI